MRELHRVWGGSLRICSGGIIPRRPHEDGGRDVYTNLSSSIDSRRGNHGAVSMLRSVIRKDITERLRNRRGVRLKH